MSKSDDQIELPATYVGAQPPSGFDNFGGGFDVSGNGFNSGTWGSGGVDPSRYGDVGEIYDSERIIDRLGQNAASAIQQANNGAQSDYEAKSATLPAAIDQQVAAVRAEAGAQDSSPVEGLNRDVAARSTLIERKTAELQTQVVTANAYYGTNPIGRSAKDYVNEGYRRIALEGAGLLKLQQDMDISYKAAYAAKLLEAEIQLLNGQVATLKASFAEAQAQDPAHLAAEEQKKELEALAYWANRYNTGKDPIVKQYNLNKANVEGNVQAKLDAVGASQAPPDGTPLDWINKAIESVTQVLNQEYEQQKSYNAVLANYPGVDFKNSDLKNFLERTRDKQLDPEVAFAQEMQAIQAAYAADVMNDEFNSLQGRLPILNAAKAEAQRVAAEAIEQARLAAEAEAKRVADEQARVAAETIRTANTFRAPGPASSVVPVVMTSAGTIAVIEAAAVTLQAAIRSAIAALTSLAAGTASGLLVGVSALVYSPKLANGELPERYAFSTPLLDLAPEHGQDLPAIAAASGTVDLPVRISSKTAADGQSEVIVVKTDGVTVPSKVRVVAATYNAEQNVYSVTTGDVPPRTLTWTPIVNPGNSSTTSPAEQPIPPVYTGATVTPVEGRIDTFPAVVEAGFDDFITVFPADSGLPPIYVMFRDRREDAGVATGTGQPVTGIWLDTASQGEGVPIPSQIADQLRGKEFKNFRDFREAFWKAVANDPELAKQFDPGSLAAMRKGYSAFVRKAERVGGRRKYELHHKQYISLSGDVYNIDNVNVITPKRHIETHQENK